jgi:hypothetical protein
VGARPMPGGFGWVGQLGGGSSQTGFSGSP